MPKHLPVNGGVVVRPDAPLTKYGSILIPESAQKKTQWGDVISTTSENTDLLGKKVMYSRFAAANWVEDGDVCLNEEDIYAEVVVRMSAVELEPRHDWIWVKPEAIASETKGGIATTFTIEGEERFGKVLAKGPDAKEVSPNERIMFNRWTGLDIVIDQQKYLLIQERDVYGVCI